MIHQFLRTLGGRTIINQMRGELNADSLSRIRASINDQLNDKISEAFEKDTYVLDPKEITTDNYTWCAHIIPETQTFERGLPRWSLCVASYVRGKVHRAMVFEPHSGNYFWVRKGQGAYEKLRRLHFSDVENLADTLIAVHGASPFPANQAERAELFPPSVHQLMSTARDFVNSGSWLLDLLDCVAGRLDVFYGVPPSPALARVASLFVTEIGGVFERGSSIKHKQPNALLVSNMHLSDELRHLLADLPASDSKDAKEGLEKELADLPASDSKDAKEGLEKEKEDPPPKEADPLT